MFFYLRVSRIVKSNYWLRHIHRPVRPSVGKKKFSAHWTDFHEVLQVFEYLSRKSDKNNSHFTFVTTPHQFFLE
jgi:hypothetical protein